MVPGLVRDIHSQDVNVAIIASKNLLSVAENTQSDNKILIHLNVWTLLRAGVRNWDAHKHVC